MRKLSWVASISLLFILYSSELAGLSSREHAQAGGPQASGQLTAKEAKRLEEGLATNPDNLAAREQLISYYFEAMLTSRTPELEEKREEHVLWIIEHHPESEMAGSPEAGIMPVGFSGSTEGYHRGKQLWLEQVEKHPDSQRILRNAAQYLSLFDGKTSRELLQKAAALDPSDTETSSRLAQSYEHERMVVTSPEERIVLAQKAFAIRERGLEQASGEDRFDHLADVATSALEAGQIVKAEQYASELLEAAPKFTNSWNYGNALHKGNIILGRVSLQRGDIVGAKQHLLAAGETPGSPQLDSFGPNMTLAKELLEKGEREIVLTYLQSCARFWKMHDGKLQAWAATVKGGGIPDFGGNLLY